LFSFSPLLNYWLQSFYGNASIYILVLLQQIHCYVFCLDCCLEASVWLLYYYGTVTTLHYQLLQQRWHYWVKGTSHMQHYNYFAGNNCYNYKFVYMHSRITNKYCICTITCYTSMA
jgi:hypothetical protein